METDIQKIIQSKGFTKVIIGVGIALSVLVVFEAGVFVGVHKAESSFRVGDNYYRALGTSGGRELFGEGLSEAHGAAGKIISVALPRFIVEENNNTEKAVLVGDDTAFRSFHDATTSGALTPGAFVIVIGEPNDKGEVEASLVRLLPPPPNTNRPQP